MKHHWLPLAMIISLPACAGPSERQALGQEEHQIVQVRLPRTGGNASALGLEFVGEFSIRKGHGTLVPTNHSGQSIAMDYGNESGHGRAVVVTHNDKLYVFPQSSGNSKSSRWTKWQAASFSTDDHKVARNLLRSIETPRSPPGDDAPVARFRTMRFVDYLDNLRSIREGTFNEFAPSCERA